MLALTRPTFTALLGFFSLSSGEVGEKPGSISTTSASAHIYDHDWDKVPEMLRRGGGEEVLSFDELEPGKPIKLSIQQTQKTARGYPVIVDNCLVYGR